MNHKKKIKKINIKVFKNRYNKQTKISQILKINYK